MDRSPADPVISPPLRTSAERAAALALLHDEDLRPRGLLRNASNGTLLVGVGGPEPAMHAVYKPRAGERPLWDFPRGTLGLREVAAYRVSEFLGWHLVPPTVWREGPMGAGSVQLFVAHDPREHYFTLVDRSEHRAALARMALYDLLVNNADRKATHVLVDGHGLVFGVDHGLTFHVEAKLRTVIWDLGGDPVAATWRDDLARLAAALRAGGALRADLDELLASSEQRLLARRAEALSGLEILPVVPEDERPYPWPLL